MDSLIYILFICIAVPLCSMLALIEKKSRLTVGFMIIGMFMCMFISGVNGLILQSFDNNLFYVTTTFTPITEEIIKALPIVFFAFLFSDKLETLISISMATGIGFAMMENAFMLISNNQSVSILWALIRAFGAGLMHGVCTAVIGIGISFVHKRKKLFYTGTFALLSVAIVYHAIYNCLVQSRFKFAGFLLPIVTYIPIVIMLKKKKNTSNKRPY